MRVFQQCGVHATHQPFNDPECRALDAQCVVLHVRTQQALEAAQARWRQAVAAVAAVQLHQQGDAVQGLLPHLLVLTGKLQGVTKQVVNGRNFGVCFFFFLHRRVSSGPHFIILMQVAVIT